MSRKKPNSKSSWEENLGTIVTIAAVLFVCCGTPIFGYMRAHWNERHITCTVTDKDRTGGKNASQRVYTKQCGVLENKDMWFRGKTNSADVWASIERGHTYNMHVVGWRLSLTSSFPVILDVKEVKN